jgi:hypothetical protein
MKFFRELIKGFIEGEVVWGICAGLIAGIAVLGIAEIGTAKSHAANRFSVASSAMMVPAKPRAIADIQGLDPSPQTQYMLKWIADSNDAVGMPFVIVDKKAAHIYVFDDQGNLRGDSPILLGSAVGDDTTADAGNRVDNLKPEERTTPAGRFIGQRGMNAHKEDVVWVDYDAAISMHRVLTSNKSERRLERLATPTIDDNRISQGCINIPKAFFEAYVEPTFAHQRGVVYVLPEVKPIRTVFTENHTIVGENHTLVSSTD